MSSIKRAVRDKWVWLIAIAIAVSQPSMAGEVLDRVMQSGHLRMPNESEWPPYSFTNDQGVYTGFDVEVAREVARRMGFELDVVTKADGSFYTWEEQTTAQWGDGFDMVIGSMTPTAKRDEVLDFPVVYYYALGALAVHRDNTSIRTPADASGKRIGALRSANYELYLRRQPFGIKDMPEVTYKISDPVVVTYDVEEDAFNALAKGDGVELDAMVNYLPVFMEEIKKGKPFRIIGQPLYRVPQSVAVLPGDAEFAAKLKDVVEGMHKDGTLSKLSLQWLDFDMTEQ
jgi:polar amino acid transport system substrate-binding protein